MKSRSKGRSRGSETDLLRCQEAVGYLFRREGLLRKSLTHSSVKDEKNPSNERLEFLGDAILGMVISEYLFSMLPENDEGDLTKIKSVVVSSQTLARLGLEVGLDRFLMTGKGIRMKAELPRSLIANAVEAIIAAVYLDRGMEAARHFILDHLHPYVEEVLSDEHEGKNYKSLLQQAAQKEFGATPAYRVLSELGPDHAKSFKVAAVISGREYPAGRGASKKEAEQDAAKVALDTLKNEKGRGSRRRRKSSSNGRPASKGRSGPPPKKDSDDGKGSGGRKKRSGRRSSGRKAPAKSGGKKASGKKAPSKSAPSKSAPAKSAPAKKAPAKSSGGSSGGGKKKPSRRRRRSKADSPKK